MYIHTFFSNRKKPLLNATDLYLAVKHANGMSPKFINTAENKFMSDKRQQLCIDIHTNSEFFFPALNSHWDGINTCPNTNKYL